MAVLTVQTIDRAGDGLTPAFAAADVAGDQWPNDGTTFLVVKNGSGAPITATIVTPQNVAGLGVADLTVTVPAAGERWVGSFPQPTFNATNGRASVTYSAVTSVTVGAFKLS